MQRFCVFLLFVSAALCAQMPNRKAIAHLQGPQGVGVRGNVTFEQKGGAATVTVIAVVEGLVPGKHGFHIHEKGDITTCDAAGAHFNPDHKNHGGQSDTVRHVGDLGNIVADANGIATITLEDKIISLTGNNSIIGRSVVVHQNEDDLGKQNTDASKTTGSAGGRVVCGVIGIQDPITPWFETSGSSHISTLSVGILTVAAALLTKL